MAAAGPVPDELSIDSRHVKAHRSAAGSKRGSSRKRLAVRAAGTSQIHALADDRGSPVAIALTRETSNLTRAQDPKDAVEDRAVNYIRHAARLFRQQRPNGGLSIVGEFIAMIQVSRLGV
jgi:hypothetical protein